MTNAVSLKEKILSPMKKTYLYALCALTSLPLLTSCDEEAPAKEDTPELITKVELVFAPVTGGADIVVTATDPDGIGFQPIEPDQAINLALNKEYTLTLRLLNGLADPTEPEYNVHEEVKEEGDEHMFFFSWTGGFVDPAGNGNIDNRSDVVNYLDEDENGLPIGLSTRWKTTDVATADKKFRLILKHQPGEKTATSTAGTGEDDLDLEFTLTIQ
jgi:hypothetical protein